MLSQIQVEGGADARRHTFYTSLYRTYERLVNINGDGRYYSACDHRVHKSGRDFYIDDRALWEMDHPQGNKQKDVARFDVTRLMGFILFF